MIGYKILIIPFIFLSIAALPAQVKGKKITVPNDSSKIQSAAYPVYINSYNNTIIPGLSDHKLSLTEMYNLYYLYGRRNSYLPYNEFDFSDLLQGEKYENKFTQEDSLQYFNKNLYLILNLQKRELNKYDLGSLGKFLALSNEVMAIILAARQLKK